MRWKITTEIRIRLVLCWRLLFSIEENKKGKEDKGDGGTRGLGSEDLQV